MNQPKRMSHRDGVIWRDCLGHQILSCLLIFEGSFLINSQRRSRPETESGQMEIKPKEVGAEEPRASSRPGEPRAHRNAD